MSDITSLNPTDNGDLSRNVINTNFDNLNADKLEDAPVDGKQYAREDGSWSEISTTGSGDMLKATYDPQTIEADAFDTDNHTDGTTTKVFQLTDRENITTNAVTGMLSGGAITINSGDNTTFDMAAYKAQFVDHTAGTITIVEGVGFTAVKPTILVGETVTDIFLESNGTLSYAIGVTPKQRRSKIIMTRVGVPLGQGTQIFDLFERTQLSYDGNLSDTDAFSIFAPIMNVDGNNVYTANGANLSLNKSAGSIFQRGSNFYVDGESPDVSVTPTDTLLSFRLVYGNGAGGSTVGPLTTTYDPTLYDDLSGTLQPVPNNKFTIPHIYLTANNLTLIEPGQVLYNSLNEAKLSISISEHIRTVTKGSLLRSALVVKKQATDLTDTSEAQFFIADELGKLGGGGSTAASGVDLQTSYNQSVQPQIVTSATLGAVQIQRGSALDTDNVFEIANGAGTVTASIKGDGIPTADEDLATKKYVDDAGGNPLAVISDITGVTGADQITNTISLTKAEYDAIGVKDIETLYNVTDEGEAGGGANEFMIVEDQKASGVDGGIGSVGAWVQRDLNTVVVNDIFGASLSSNQVTLPAGTYKINFSAPGYDCADFKARLRNDTDTTYHYGTNNYSDTTDPSQVNSIGGTILTLAGTKVFDIQMRVGISSAFSFGRDAGFAGIIEVYSRMEIEKLS